MYDQITLSETVFWEIILHRDQAYLGRCVVVLKRECPSFSEVSIDEMIDFQVSVVRNLETCAKKVFGTELSNWSILMNMAYRENPAKPQVHWHFRPRHRHSIEFAGETFEDPEFGSHYDNERKNIVEDDVYKQIADKMKEFI